MLTWDAKDPDEVLDYDIDWTQRLYSADELDRFNSGQTVVPADHIASSEFHLPEGASLIANSSSFTATATKVWLSGGDLNLAEPYEILNRITTTGGRTMDQTVRLKIKSK